MPYLWSATTVVTGARDVSKQVRVAQGGSLLDSGPARLDGTHRHTEPVGKPVIRVAIERGAEQVAFASREEHPRRVIEEQRQQQTPLCNRPFPAQRDHH